MAMGMAMVARSMSSPPSVERGYCTGGAGLACGAAYLTPAIGAPTTKAIIPVGGCWRGLARVRRRCGDEPAGVLKRSEVRWPGTSRRGVSEPFGGW
jgi:hypothetical protein